MKTVDEQAISETLDGNPQAFADLVTRHQMAVMRLCLFVSGEYDTAVTLLKRTFLSFANNMVSYRYKGDVHEDLITHACAEISSWISRGAQKVSDENDMPPKLTKAFYIPAEEISRIQNLTMEQVRSYSVRVVSALSKVSPEIKLAVGLKIFEKKKYTDIASLINIPETRVRQRLSEFRKALMAR